MHLAAVSGGSCRGAVWLLAAAVGAALAIAAPIVQAAAVGRIVGNFDGISRDGEQLFISGWACQQGQRASILVHVFAGSPTDPKRTFIVAGRANLDSEPAVADACQDKTGGKHRFLIVLPFGHSQENVLSIFGIRVVDGVANEAIAGSGQPRPTLPGLTVPYPTVPTLSGTFHSLAEHPRVFTTAAALKDLATRINRPGSYSTQRFGQLAEQIKRDLATRIDWDVTYSGCIPWIYQ